MVKQFANQEAPLPSPCVSICVLNDDDICTGCYRSGEEIGLWGTMDNEQKLEVFAQMKVRARKMNPFLSE
ncbi:MAG: DUF1289 domain-containing protein [Cellvibrionaceae bacterium]|nr:DUF1289 domain-containing protein [Cellvibrionaceae bacterium]